MKALHLLLLSLTITILSACSISNNTDHIKREDVLGYWKLSDKANSTSNKGKQKTGYKIITGFQLNSDSTVAVSFASSNETVEKLGAWKWKAEKKLGNDNFGVTFSSDVVITVQKEINELKKLGMMLSVKGEKLFLTVSEDVYEKR